MRIFIRSAVFGKPNVASERSASDIAAHFDISWPAISQNLRVQCDSGLVAQRKVGHYRLYSANHAAIGALGPFLRAMWSADAAV